MATLDPLLIAFTSGDAGDAQPLKTAKTANSGNLRG